MPSPDLERVRESYNSSEPEPLLVELTRKNCTLLKERTAALAARDQEVRELEQTIHALTQRIKELEAKVLCDSDEHSSSLMRWVSELNTRLRGAATTVEHLTVNTTVAPVCDADDWYAAEVARLGTPTA